MHIATVLMYYDRLRPSLDRLSERYKEKIEEFKDIIKIGRTHM